MNQVGGLLLIVFGLFLCFTVVGIPFGAICMIQGARLMGKAGGQAAEISSRPSATYTCRQCPATSDNMAWTPCCKAYLCKACLERWQQDAGWIYSRCALCGKIVRWF